MAQAGRSGAHDQPEGRGSRFRLGRLAQEKQRVAGIACAMMQATRRRQVEMDGVPARLQKHGAKAVERGGLLGDPQRVGQFLRLRDQQAGGIDAVEEKDARRIRIAGFAKAFGHADPKDGGLRSLERQADQRENEGGRGARIARAGRMDLGKPGAGQAAAECGVETFRASDEKIPSGTPPRRTRSISSAPPSRRSARRPSIFAI